MRVTSGADPGGAVESSSDVLRIPRARAFAGAMRRVRFGVRWIRTRERVTSSKKTEEGKRGCCSPFKISRGVPWFRRPSFVVRLWPGFKFCKQRRFSFKRRRHNATRRVRDERDAHEDASRLSFGVSSLSFAGDRIRDRQRAHDPSRTLEPRETRARFDLSFRVTRTPRWPP